MQPSSWDIFCTVIDNYGDIGVSWRLARQLAHDHDQRVRLWVDDLQSFAHIAPGLDAGRARQRYQSVEVCHWPASEWPMDTQPADVVIEAFGCPLPGSYLAAMAARSRRPVWFNLEYLSAEDWVEDCHDMASPHPQLPLVKHFFFPGFTRRTGGLLCERTLLEERVAWQADAAVQVAFWQGCGVPPQRQAGELRISVFSYETTAFDSWLPLLAAADRPVRLLVPRGKALSEVARVFGQPLPEPGTFWTRGNLTVHTLPLTDQAGYDRLLWSCDLNLVRGEDSFVRAQWAARPFLWHIYPQEEDAHLVKLEAFLTRYERELPQEAAHALTAAMQAWNNGVSMEGAWPALLSALPVLADHARHWPQTVLAHGDLAARLVQSARIRLQ